VQERLFVDRASCVRDHAFIRDNGGFIKKGILGKIEKVTEESFVIIVTDGFEKIVQVSLLCICIM